MMRIVGSFYQKKKKNLKILVDQMYQLYYVVAFSLCCFGVEFGRNNLPGLTHSLTHSLPVNAHV